MKVILAAEQIDEIYELTTAKRNLSSGRNKKSQLNER
jgi:hypothetical protein